MVNQRCLSVAAAAVLSVAGLAMAQPAGLEEVGQNLPGDPEAGGPDVIVGDLHNLTRWGVAGGITAYSVGTISCNIGNVDVLWQATNPNHPVIGQNMYRLKDGRFEQVGMSWLKHGFTALTESLCGTCNGHGGPVLGVGCSDPYGASLNGSYSTGGNTGGLGCRNQVNAFTGVFIWPPQRPSQAPAPIGGRLQVHNEDLNPALNPNARYYVEGQYVTHDDAAAGNGTNNCSYREITVGASPNFNIAFRSGASTQRTRAAVEAWRAADTAVTIRYIQVPSEGLFILGYKVTQTGPTTWHYEYALQNINSDRCGAGFAMNIPACATVSNAGFHAPEYHSGEPYSNAAWGVSEGGGRLAWSSPETFAQNPNTNALRWGTLYNFRFDCDRPPMNGNVDLTLFKPGTPTSVAMQGLVPRSLADFNADGMIDLFDMDAFIVAFEAGDLSADFNGDGFLDFFDADGYVAAFEAGC